MLLLLHAPSRSYRLWSRDSCRHRQPPGAMAIFPLSVWLWYVPKNLRFLVQTAGDSGHMLKETADMLKAYVRSGLESSASPHQRTCRELEERQPAIFHTSGMLTRCRPASA